MPDLAKVQALEAKLNAEPQPAPENPAGAPPDGGSSGSGSAPADGTPAAAPAADAAKTSPGAPIDHSALRQKLEEDRARRASKARRAQLEADAEAAKKAREEAEAEKAKWSNLGKGKSFLEAIKEAGHDPLKTFELMKDEALKAGTPEARLEAMSRAWEARHEALEKALEAEKSARAEERKAAEEAQKRTRAQAEHQAFVHEFDRTLRDPRYETLTDEYEPAQIFHVATTLSKNPDEFFRQALDLKVNLTSNDGTFTMKDILEVMKATQERHFARLEEQRRKKSAAPQTSPESPQQPPVAKTPTVNGTAERNAGTSLGNQLAAARASDPTRPRRSRQEKLKELERKFPG